MEGYKQVDCFKRNFMFWKFLGIYPLTVSRPLSYALYSRIFIFTIIIMYSVLFTINLYFVPKYLDNYIEELIFYFSVLSILCKVLTFIIKKDKIKKIISFLESDVFQPESKKAIKIINEAKNKNQQYWKIYGAVCITCNIVHVLSPLLIHLVFKADLILPVSSYSFLPENIRRTLIYPVYFYQSIGMHIHVLCTVNIDSFFVGLMVFLIAQLEILEEKFINVTENFEAESKTQQNDVDLILKLNKVFIHYNDVVKFCSIIQDIFSIVIFVHFSMGSYIICMCLIRFTMPAPWQYLIFLSNYSLAMVLQIYVPCWFGTRIMDKSSHLTHAIYNCDWTPRSKRFKGSLLLFIHRASRPLSITGWKMFLLSLVTFTSIMNTAYSFFTLLRHMQTR